MGSRMSRWPMWAMIAPVILTAAPAGAQTWRTFSSERQVWSDDPVRIDIQYGAGTLRVEPADSPTLYRMELRYDEQAHRPLVSYDENANRLRLGVESHQNIRRNAREGSRATIALTREVPLDLDLEFGAGEADIRLGGVSLRRVEISTGASQTTVRFDRPNPIAADEVTIEAGAADLRVLGLGNTRARRIQFKGGVGATVLDFGGAWGGNASVSVEMGIGSITLRLPRDQGVRLNRSSFLTSFSAPGLERRGDSYYSANWQTAQQQLTLDISAALGSIEIQWVD